MTIGKPGDDGMLSGMSEAQTLRGVANWLYSEYAINGADGQYMPDPEARYMSMIHEAAAEIERLRALLDQVATQSTHPDRDGPGCWWCIAEAGQPHEAGCKYAAERAGGEA
jgi:hypothetical protein